MPPQALALLAALCFAGSHVASKRGLVTASVPAAVLTSLFAATFVAAVAAILSPPRDMDLRTIGVFAAAGLVAPGIARWASTMGVHRLGPSRSVPIAQGANPLIATVGGIGLLGEPITPAKLIGVITIASGSFILATKRPDRLSALAVDEIPERTSSRPVFRSGIAFPLIAALSYATSALLAKSVLEDPSYAPFGTAVGMSAALITWSIGSLHITRLREQLVLGDGLKWLLLSGGLTGAATLYLFSALNAGDISVVSPITASQSLIVFLLSRAILHDIEELTVATIAAGTFVAIGTAILLS